MPMPSCTFKGIALAVSLVACTAASSAGNTDAAARSRSASFASLASLPDWSGTWTTSRQSGAEVLRMTSDRGYSGAPQLRPKFEAQLRQANTGTIGPGNDVGLVNDNTVQCLPHGMPLMMALPSPIGYEFLFTPGQVTILSEENEIRRIYTDGRRHDVDADDTYSGESIGHWQGQTLVVDTVAIKAKAMLMLFAVQDSGKTHVRESIRLKDENTLEIDTTVEDPIVLTAPWHYRLTFERSHSSLLEYICQENNREQGGELNMTPPE